MPAGNEDAMKRNTIRLLCTVLLLSCMLQGCNMLPLPKETAGPTTQESAAVPTEMTVAAVTEASEPEAPAEKYSCDLTVTVGQAQYTLQTYGIECLQGGISTVVYEDSFPENGYLCTNGEIAYAINAAHQVLSVDLKTAEAKVLFQADPYARMCGVLDHGLCLADTTRDPDATLAGYEIVSYSFTGEKQEQLAQGYFGRMASGVLLLTAPQTDVRPTVYIAIAQDGTVLSEGMAWGIGARDGALYTVTAPDDYPPSSSYTVKLIKTDTRGSEVIKEFTEHLLDSNDFVSVYDGSINIRIFSSDKDASYTYDLYTGKLLQSKVKY